MHIAVVGTGYVGLVAGACFASTGNNLICVDIDEDKIKRLENGDIPIYEPGLEDLVKEGIDKERLHFTTDIDDAVKACDVIFIAVGTPPSEDGSADLKHVLAVAHSIGKAMNNFKIIVDKSTVPVGTAGLVSDAIREHTDYDFTVVSNPEFLKEGDAINDFLKPERVIIGADDDIGHEVLNRLYRPFMLKANRIIHMDVVSAELTKYTANSFLATRISFINEIARLCEKVGADIDMVRQGIGSDSRIGPAFLFAGAGYGGSCFPKDVKAILRTAKQYDVKFELIEATERVNEEQKKILFSKIDQHYNGEIKGKTFAIWGLSFKPRTDDMREAPSIILINSLLAAGANVRAFDPEAMEVAKVEFGDSITYCDSEYDAIEGADALVLVTEWNDFRTPNHKLLFEKLTDKVVFDGRNVYDPKYVQSFGLTYVGIGRGIA
ncbi:MAG TPA: UDP-glucose/GDP-mannose dehydrogenase family protein [Bacteroidetes bacterium]|nr:UDP-glucose 6-dehydrogenase TuaD [bacterium BMS3Bbin04]HDO64508.1 UDP-glucose/GDP-mannose dehydrogenase family protein [Bacteroidota bacterium]HEX03633.1 UDP-glucose/GDP-mannose dehydrogenase family protein [Bacteroidota bacterium]